MATIQELSAAGRHQECLQACQNALRTSQEEAYSYKYAGKSLLALGQFEKAQQCLIKAHQLDGSDPETVKDIGNIFLNLGNKDTAFGWYEKALEINNNYAPAFNNLASLKRQSGNNQEAIYLFKRAIQADPKLIQAYVGAAASFLALGDLDQAEPFAAQALEINESIPGVNEILGIIFQKKSKPDQAIECYQKELEINPKASNSFLNLGVLLLQKGQTVAALESFVKASTLAPSDQCSLLLAQAYQNLGQFKEAIFEYKKLDINNSQNKMIPFNLGLCFLNTGNNTDAIEAFKLAVQLDDSLIAAWGTLGNALKEEGRLEEALQAMKKVLDLDPDNPTAHMNLGGIWRSLGQLDKALESTLKSLVLLPGNYDALTNLGLIYKLLGDYDQALTSFGEAVKTGHNSQRASMALAETYADVGHYHDAIKTLSEVGTNEANNLLLSLYLILDMKLEFNCCAADLISKRGLDQRGVAAVDHSNNLYNQALDNGLVDSTMNSVFTQAISAQEFSDESFEQLLSSILKFELQPRSQLLLVNGSQTSGNILELPQKPFQRLKELLIQKISHYNQSCDINTDKNFDFNWKNRLYKLSAWAIIMDKGGNLKSHNHELGWLTGTFYLQMPKREDDSNQGAIEFTHHGPKYPKGNSFFERKVLRPKVRDLNIFSSSLFHRTLPFESDIKRVCIAFDVTRNKQFREASN